MAVGYYVSRALHLVVKLGIPDLLAQGPRPFAELAEATATQPPSLNRALRLLASVGVFEEQENGRFALRAYPVSDSTLDPRDAM
jgi:DNA-binding IclR family transcriptional regulator